MSAIYAPDTERVKLVLNKVSPFGGTHANALNHHFVFQVVNELSNQDASFFASGQDTIDEKSFKDYRTYVRSLGRGQGTFLIAHMAMGPDTLVYAHPDCFDVVAQIPESNPATGVSYEGLFPEEGKATLTRTLTTFVDELSTGKYTQAIVVGSDSFQGYLDRGLTELRELCAKYLKGGPLPRLYVLN